MNETVSILMTCGVCCIYPIIVAVAAVAVDRRVRAHGWRSLLPRTNQSEEQ